MKSRARIARTLDLLEEFGIELGMPYVRFLEKQLWELRIRWEGTATVSFIFYRTEEPLFCSMRFQKD